MMLTWANRAYRDCKQAWVSIFCFPGIRLGLLTDWFLDGEAQERGWAILVMVRTVANGGCER